ncbi:MAG: flagellar FlbD family protein [Planctomycetes bacterium]|nr:flagellar FlbD family protein [Planctomycetota bacterium]
MIRVTRLNGAPLVVNADLIELVEPTPDTVIVLTTRNRVMVKESVDEVVQRVIAFQRSLRPTLALES